MVRYILIFSAIIVGCLACKCSTYMPLTAACSADFVVKAKVDGETRFRPSLNDPYYRWYHLTTHKVFKRTDAATNVFGTGKFSFNISNLEGTSCSMNLDIKEMYLITGRIHDGKAELNACDWHLKWSDLTCHQRQGFKHNYYERC